MLDVVEHDGQPVEAAWAYLPSLPADVKLWVPPAVAGTLFHGKGTRTTGGLLDVKANIDQGQPVLVITSLSDAFYWPDGDGAIDSPEPVDPNRMHALIGVGYGMRGPDAFTLVRNSWGDAWGLSGYAWLSDRYLAPRMLEFATMIKVT